MTTTKRNPATKAPATKAPAKKAAKAKPYYPTPKLKKGEIYVGAIMTNDRPEHLVLLPGEHTGATHAQALEWAAKQDGELPSRAAALMLFERQKNQFQPDIYWTSQPYERCSGCAWTQVFNPGSQDYWLTDGKLRARAVRRIVIK